MRQIERTGKFKKHYQRMISTFKDEDVKAKEDEFEYIVTKLALDQKLESMYKNHPLKGYSKSRNIWECHIDPDWLLIYEKTKDRLRLILIDTGTHSDLFK